MVVESQNDRVLLLDPFDATVIDDLFIDIEAQLPKELDSATPIHAMQVNGEIWVTDQLRSRINRFDLEGEYLGTIGAEEDSGLSNIRGMGLIGDTVYLTNAGTANNAPGESIHQLDLDGNILGHFLVSGSPWHVLEWGENLLISFSGTGSRIEEYDLNGNSQGVFHQGSPSFVQQMHANSKGGVYASTFSGTATRGVYEFDADGNQINFWNTPVGARGVWELGNGMIMYTGADGVHLIDPETDTLETIITGTGNNFRFVDILVLDKETPLGDLNGDGVVNVFDLLILLEQWGACDDPSDCPADLNGDGEVNVFDLLILLENWG